MNNSRFDAIVSGFYQAASGQVPWEVALDGLREAFDARMVFLHTADARDGRIISIRHAGPPTQGSVLEYVRNYHRMDPRREVAIARAKALNMGWWHCHEDFNERFAAQNPFYREFLSAYGARYTSSVVLAPGGPADPIMSAFALEMTASRGVLSTDECESVRRLGEHLLDALRVYRRVRALLTQALAGHQLLQGFGYPMWVVDQERLVSFANRAAGDEAASGVRITVESDRLRIRHNRANQRLTEALHTLFARGHGAATAIDMRATAADPPTWLHVSILTPTQAMGAFGDQAQALATLFDPTAVRPLDPFALSNMFDLTPAEARVAAGLADGLTAQEISALVGTAQTTVRTQVRQVLAKLGARRVVDVVRILRQGEALWATAGDALV